MRSSWLIQSFVILKEYRKVKIVLYTARNRKTPCMMQEVRLALFMIKKSCRKKNLEVDSSRICPKKANFHIVTGRSDHFEFCDSHLVEKNFERLQIILQRLFLDKWKFFC